MPTLLYCVFALSGAAGLIYESIWSRYLGLFVGHSAYAQVIVLVIYLGGMSLGALLVGGRSERLRQPLIAYAAVEGIVGLIGLVFHDVYGWATALAYDHLFPALPNEGAVVLVKWALAGLLILPQSVLLGMTFPLMSAGVLRIIRTRPGHVLALLYFTNSLGAAAGALMAGFWLTWAFGLPGTLLAAAMMNLVAALVTFVGVRGARPAQAAEDAAGIENARGGLVLPLGAGALWRMLLGVSFGTAVASFVYEIAWIRMLSMVLGSATHSFELLLSAFILGLALGALWTQRRADAFGQPLRVLGIVQLCMGLAAMLTLPVYLRSYGWTASLLGALARTDAGYTWFGIARYGLCLAVMLPATFCAGITLPLITRTLIASGRGERAIGAVYGVNTIGSIIGAALAGLVLLPLTGVKNLLILGAVVDMGLGVMLLRAVASRPRTVRLAWVAAAAMVVAALLSSLLNRFDPLLLSSGVFRYGRVPKAGSQEVAYYRDGRTASVIVTRHLDDRSLVIATNGKPDASLDTTWFRWRAGTPPHALGGDVSTQVLLPLLTLAHMPRAREAAVIGEGSGLTSHILLGSSTLRRLTTIEIEPAMIEGSRRFYPANRRVFDDPRSRFVLDDARSYFAAANRRFDIIVSEPSNPWVSGVSGLFTTEFYGRVRRYLTPDGIFGQWLHLYEIDDGLVLSVLTALHQNFRSYDVYMTSPVDILIVATNAPAVPRPDWGVFGLPSVRQDLRAAIPFRASSLEALHLADRAALEPVIRRFGVPNSDYYPILDLSAERTRFLNRSALGFTGLLSDRFDVPGALEGRRSGFDSVATTTVPSVPRAAELAIGAAVRLGTPGPGRAALLAGGALHRRYQLEASLALDRGPEDWHAWMRDLYTAESDLHGGTAGVADEPFYGRAEAFLERHNAPAGARSALAFMHGLAAWNFQEAARAGDALVAESPGSAWVPPDALRDGATVAKLRLGDAQGARRVWTQLAGESSRPGSDLRALLIEAQLQDALERQGRAAR